jgi:hypothetical protein
VPKQHLPERLHVVVAVWLVLAALIGVVGFDTVDSLGVQRVRSAIDVWRTVISHLPSFGAGNGVVGIYYVALTTTVVGLFALVWLAASGWKGDAPAPTHSAEAFRTFTATVLRTGHSPRVAAFAGAVTVALVVFAMWRLGAFAPARVLGVSDTFASFDHPFHVGRAQALLDSLRHGENLRWVANHHGGYPAEFYPLGFAWFEILLWGATAGQLAIPTIHKFAVIVLMLGPALLFHVMARRDGWPATVALAAFTVHIVVPGGMWHGGYSELVYMGLVANVSAAFAVLCAMVASTHAFGSSAGPRWIGLAAAASAAAMWCNPRSAVGLVVCVGAAWLVALWSAPRNAHLLAVRLGAIAALAGLLAAPELASLLHYGNLYYFVRFTSYSSSLDYLSASIDAVSLPGFALALAGCFTAIAVRGRGVTSTTAVALGLYASTTMFFAFGGLAVVQQLEATRLMPVQRLLTAYLAGVGLHAIAGTAGAALRRRWLPSLCEGAAIVVLIFVFVGTDRLLPFWSRGLYPVQRSSVDEMALFQNVVSVADRTAPADTAILVVGSTVSTHQQLWAPVRVPERLYFYDYWMWYWHQRHHGPYDPSVATRYDSRRLAELFERDYLDAHAIGAVIVTPVEQPFADRSANLQRIFAGDYGLYVVKDPTRVVSFVGGGSNSITVSNHSIIADGTSTGGEAIIRRNWFPRWKATVNGHPTPIRESDDGYMRVPVSAGRVYLTLRYGLDRLDVLARAAGVLGVLVFLLLVCVPKRGIRAND